ncbi:thioredoxin domain-containing protein [Streptomyces sp. UNOC14_S4]|uniref:thioredoxin domain-containing protein n=1 Tax=Streptomyces sp. UNOC14_S4 TaxID=2872340 RepID=UPI001E50629D|nr:thioredoxin domain-containing protein [Streptomyces sp. UNOC14_S4]MCC3770287.1 DsbA family protein [Streptomyces sp. UNOC14_S4]
MSNRNNQQNKQAARDRLRAERERQAKKDKARRQLVVAGSIVAVLAIAGGIGYAVTKAGDGGSGKGSFDWAAAKNAPVVKPANTAGENGNEIVVGDPKAKETLTVYEDPRCPVCAVFEQRSGTQLRQDVADGRYKVRYIMANFIDDSPARGTGSKNAVSALGAALNISPQAFVDYKEALYSPKNHPDERDDAFADDKKLIDIAQQVRELKGNKEFEKNVTEHTYAPWALKLGRLFGKNGINSTPALVHNGKQLKAGGTPNPPIAKEDFITAINKEFGSKDKG